MTRSAIIVAHGQPSDPAPAEAEIAALAAKVAAHLPGWTVRSATLAQPGALDRAVAGLEAPLVFPFFMADGWFIRTAMPDRLARASAKTPLLMTPFGLLPEALALAAETATAAAASRGWAVAETTLILAAHGSGRSPHPREAAELTAKAIGETSTFAAIRCGFIEEEPEIADVAGGTDNRALCLPLFVARWGHVETDLPAALAKARFAGALLEPLGTAPEVPGIIARALTAAMPSG
ncbi:MAG TPA: CbiX/SirB N-terminal domain-containing protein [Albidovulum sp.]|uniref:sirohydrochlorin chelatase n=1 Tax=Albidovulum sp. TaxID=1872424 RepID=UPI002CF7A6CC|nr:CbiX/SirB N-terminal domain-containing protein [Albidovulum sp.]